MTWYFVGAFLCKRNILNNKNSCWINFYCHRFFYRLVGRLINGRSYLDRQYISLICKCGKHAFGKLSHLVSSGRMNPVHFLVFLLVLICGVDAGTYNDLQTWPNRSVIVHLFEWKYKDIAKECETFLSKYNYGAVQIRQQLHHNRT
jgi:hypothetical protein